MPYCFNKRRCGWEDDGLPRGVQVPKIPNIASPCKDESKHMQNDADEPCLVAYAGLESEQNRHLWRLVDPFTRYRQGSRLH